ncbi:MAG: thioredoxin-like domain-containing protein [Bacteroidales bacterium]
MKKIVIGALSICMLASCSDSDKFKVEGKMEGAQGKTIILEKVGMNETSFIDSVKLDKNGSFKFADKKPEFKPEFYRLKVGDQIINFSVDSTETIRINANYAKLPMDYTVEGSVNSEKIKELNISSAKLKTRIDSLTNVKTKTNMSDQVFAAKMDTLLQGHKTLASKIIFENLKEAPAYYALFQKVYNYLIFDPYSREDFKVYGAVATSWNFYNPEAPRTKHLYNFAEGALSVVRSANSQNENAKTTEIQIDSIKSNFEIELPNNKGRIIPLSSTKGKVVILNFTAYQTQESPAFNMTLGNLYKEYQDKGLEIYQVSVDTDEHFWKVAANNIPWVAVRDQRSIYSPYLAMYNVQQLPTIFVLNRDGDIVERVQKVSDLSSIVKKYM